MKRPRSSVGAAEKEARTVKFCETRFSHSRPRLPTDKSINKFGDRLGIQGATRPLRSDQIRLSMKVETLTVCKMINALRSQVKLLE